MVDAHIIVRDAAGKYMPTKKATLKTGDKSATFQFETPLTVNPTNAWTVNGVAYKAPEFAIVAVESLTSKGKYLNVQFNSPISDIDASEVTVRETVALTQKGVEAVRVAADGMSAQVTLLGDEAAAGTILTANKNYTLSITQNGKVVSSTFFIPAVAEDKIVNDFDLEERTITVASVGELKVPTDMAFDFEEALGRDLTVWYNKDNEVTKFIYSDENVIYEAFREVTKDGKTYVQTLNDGKQYLLDSDARLVKGSSATPSQYGKIVLEKSGKVQSVIGRTFPNQILVESTNGDYVKSHGSELSLKEYHIVKNGKTILTKDLKAGDVVFYNSSTKIADVYTQKVSGTISNFYDNEFQLNGKIYKYGDANQKALVNGTWETITDTVMAPFTKGVDVYVDRLGVAKFITGERGEVVTTSTIGYVTKAVESYTAENDPFIKFTTKDFKGAEVETKVGIETLSQVNRVSVGMEVFSGTTVVGKVSEFVSEENSNEISFKVKDANGNYVTPTVGHVVKSASGSVVFTAVASAGSTPTNIDTSNKEYIAVADVTAPGVGAEDEIVQIIKNGDGKVTGLAFAAPTDYLSEDVKIDTKTLGAYKLNSSTPVFVKDDQGVKATTWAQLGVSEVTAKNGSAKLVQIYANTTTTTVSYVVIDNTDGKALGTGTDVNKHEVVVQSVHKKDGDVTSLVAAVNGEIKTFDIEKNATVPGLSTATAGAIIDIEVNKVSGKITKATTDADAPAGGVTSAVLTTDNLLPASNKIVVGGTELTLDNAKIYRVISGTNPQVVKVDDINALANLVASNRIMTVSALSAGSKFVDTIVVTDAAFTFTASPTASATEGATSFNFDVTGTVGTAIATGTPTPVVTIVDSSNTPVATKSVTAGAYNAAGKSTVTVNTGALTVGTYTVNVSISGSTRTLNLTVSAPVTPAS